MPAPHHLWIWSHRFITAQTSPPRKPGKRDDGYRCDYHPNGLFTKKTYISVSWGHVSGTLRLESNLQPWASANGNYSCASGVTRIARLNEQLMPMTPPAHGHICLCYAAYVRPYGCRNRPPNGSTNVTASLSGLTQNTTTFSRGAAM